MLLTGMVLINSVTGASDTIGKSLDSTRSHIDLLAALRSDFNQCRIEAPSADGTTLTYSLPMHAGADGSPVDRSGELIWEVTDDVTVHGLANGLRTSASF